MIQKLEVHNFKSIKDLKLDCKRFNIFIGEPNSGKSNLLETLGTFSWGCYWRYGDVPLRKFVRFESMANLFYDEEPVPIEIRLDDQVLKIEFNKQRYSGQCLEENKKIFSFNLDLLGQGSHDYQPASLSPIKFYRFEVRSDFPNPESDYLMPPSGANLFAVLLPRKEMRFIVKDVFAPFGLEPSYKRQENKIEVVKRYEDLTVTLPYSLVSDTLQRLVFYLAAIESNKDSVIAFEEPEAHAFPYYTKFLAEEIAKDQKNNQYFIATHNPYFLFSLLEKAPKDDVSVFVTYLSDYQTRVKLLSAKDIEEVMSMEVDIFLDPKRFVKKE